MCYIVILGRQIDMMLYTFSVDLCFSWGELHIKDPKHIASNNNACSIKQTLNCNWAQLPCPLQRISWRHFFVIWFYSYVYTRVPEYIRETFLVAVNARLHIIVVYLFWSLSATSVMCYIHVSGDVSIMSDTQKMLTILTKCFYLLIWYLNVVYIFHYRDLCPGRSA